MGCIKKKRLVSLTFLYHKWTIYELEENLLYSGYMHSLGQKTAFSILPYPCLGAPMGWGPTGPCKVKHCLNFTPGAWQSLKESPSLQADLPALR